MLKDKKIVLKYTPISMSLEALCFLLFTIGLVLAVNMYPEAPELVPNRYSISGEILEWSGSAAALIHCILAVFAYIILTGLGIIIRRLSPHNNEHSALGATLLALLLVKAVYLASAMLKTYCAMSALPMPFWAGFALPVALALIALGTAWVIFAKYTGKPCKA